MDNQINHRTVGCYLKFFAMIFNDGMLYVFLTKNISAAVAVWLSGREAGIFKIQSGISFKSVKFDNIQTIAALWT